jgi:hypothetical protein
MQKNIVTQEEVDSLLKPHTTKKEAPSAKITITRIKNGFIYEDTYYPTIDALTAKLKETFEVE